MNVSELLEKHRLQIWRLKGTKQHYIIVDMNFGGEWFIIKLADWNRTYHSSREIRVPHDALERDYVFTGKKAQKG